MTAKSTSIKSAGCRFGGCALKAVILIAGGLLHVPDVEIATVRWRASGEGPNGRKRQVGGATR
jgi:hypothetical protein